MAWPKGKPRPPGTGRKKGSPNKVTRDIKQAFFQVFWSKGIEGLTEWSEKDPAGFYKVMGSLIPKEVKTELEGELVLRWAGEED